jgi:hypothetical protein
MTNIKGEFLLVTKSDRSTGMIGLILEVLVTEWLHLNPDNLFRDGKEAVEAFGG